MTALRIEGLRAAERRGTQNSDLPDFKPNALFGDERLLDRPELLDQARPACDSATWFWNSRELRQARRRRRHQSRAVEPVAAVFDAVEGRR